MENSKRGTIPMQEKLKLSKSDGASTPAEKRRMSNVPNALAVGSIMYAVRCTRLDVAFTQNITSRFQQNPSEFHWTTLRVSCYIDAGYLTDADDLKSQTGYVLVLNGGAVDWKSTKQTISVTSSTYAEYIAAFDASKEAVWIRKFISGLNVVLTIEDTITMYCDITGAIAIANDHGVTKDDNLADPFTKALAFPKHSELTRKIGLIPNDTIGPFSRFNQINEWPFPKDIANYQYICKPATPPPKWELLEFGSWFPTETEIDERARLHSGRAH
ncbi:hypothetical protein Tco_0854884 [Tanacetum coccineum]